jgi:hypothetical protein
MIIVITSFNSAFRNAREAGEKEFMFKGERYNTNLVDKKHSDDYWDQKNFLREYYKNEPFKPLSSHDSTMFAKDLIKDKHGTTWSEYYNKILPERGNLTYNDKRYNEIQDSLEMLSEYGYKQDPAKRQELNRYIQSNLGNNELINLEEPYYFSMTNNPIVGENGTTLGFVDPRNKKLFVSTDRGGNFNTTYVHELSHKGDLGDVYLRTPKVDYETLNAFNQGRLDQGMVDYLVDPTEIEARKMSTLYYFKKNGLPYQTGKITSKQVFDLNLDIISHPEKYPHDVVQLFQLFDGQTGKLVKYFNNDFSKKKGGDISIPNLSRQEGREMPFGLPLKEQNIYTLPEYIQPINPMTGEILPDPRRPDLGMGTKASEYKYTYGFDEGDVDVPSIVAGQYIGDQALDRYRLTGERFKTMADPGSYSKFYMQMRDLGLMQEKKGGVVKKVKIKSIPKNWKSQ